MKGIFADIKKGLTIESVSIRLVMAWILVALLYYFRTGAPFYEATYMSRINIPMFICFVALVFAAFCVLSASKYFKWVEIYGPTILLTLYTLVTVYAYSELVYIVIMLLLVLASIIYAVRKTTGFAEIRSLWTVRVIYIVMAAYFIVMAGAIGVYRYLSFSNSTFDMGIWSQMFHYMKTTFRPLTTVERNELLSHFAVHYSPIYYAYLPIFAIFESPITLSILQVLTLISGIVPLYLLCRQFKLSNTATALFGILFALYPALACGTSYDLHENCFLTPLVLWIFYFAEKDDLKGLIIFSVLTILVKEDAFIYVFVIAVFMMFHKRQYVRYIIMALFSLLAFLIISYCLSVLGEGVMDSRYSSFSVAGESGVTAVVKNIITNPAFFIKECFQTDRIEFLLQLFVPLAFMPILKIKGYYLILLLPMMIVNLAANWVYQYNINFQYAFGTIAILMYMAISSYSNMSDSARRTFLSFALCATVVFVPITSLKLTVKYISRYYNNAEKYNAVEQAIKDNVPNDASVLASTFYVPHLFDRDELYMYNGYYGYDDPLEYECDYIVLDTSGGEVSTADIKYLDRNGYDIKYEIEGRIVILEKNFIN